MQTTEKNILRILQGGETSIEDIYKKLGNVAAADKAILSLLSDRKITIYGHVQDGGTAIKTISLYKYPIYTKPE